MQSQPFWSFKRWPYTIRRLLKVVRRAPCEGSHNWAFARIVSLTIVVSITVILAFLYADETVARWLRSGISEIRAVKTGFSFLTDLGESTWVLGAATVTGLYLAGLNWTKNSYSMLKSRYWWFAASNFAFVSVAGSGVLASLIKNTIGRARPKGLDEFGPFYFDFAAFTADFASFPSGHSTTFGATAVVGALLFPAYRWLFFIFGILGGFSRMVVGAHYVSDVIAGLAFGAIFTLILSRYLARRRVLFHDSTNLILTTSR